MSSKPNRQGIAEVIGWLAEIEAAETRAVEIRGMLPEAERLELRAGELRRAVVVSMRAMDVEPNGNAGWEGRVIWFLNTLRRLSAEASVCPPLGGA